MDIKEYLNEKLKDNKVAEKAKKAALTVAALSMLGTGFAGCEKIKDPKTQEEFYLAIEEKLDSQNRKFEDLSIVEIGRIGDDGSTLLMFNDGDHKIYYTISEEQCKKVIDYILSLEDLSDFEVRRFADDRVMISIVAEAMKDEENAELTKMIYDLLNNAKRYIEYPKEPQPGPHPGPIEEFQK